MSSIPPQPISMQDIIRLFETLQAGVIKSIENSSNAAASSANTARMVIELKEEFEAFKQTTFAYRAIRFQAEEQELQQQIEVLQRKLETKRVDVDPTPRLSTQDRIDKAVTTALKKDRVDWKAMFREKILPAVMTTLAIALTLALLSPAIRYWIGPALLSAFGGK